MGLFSFYIWEADGIGRRAGFRFQCHKTYGFKSRASYHLYLDLAKLTGPNMREKYDSHSRE